MSNQFHSLLASPTQASLLSNLNLPPNEERALISAAKEISQAISLGFTALRAEVRQKKLDHDVPRPKFAIQGSYIYGTMNAPAYPPAQQVDIDLGMYLPFSALGNGQQPKTATGYYFDAVTRILSEYIHHQSKSWVLPPKDRQKSTCIRVVLSETTHVDIPLYAVPEGELNRIDESKMALLKQENEYPELLTNEEFYMDSLALEAVTPDVIHMAHREEGWLPSDALVIRDWVKSQFRQMGKMIRPVNRFLKAWRDEVWREGGGPSSIFLLAHSLQSFPEKRDNLTHCDALKAVIEELPSVFQRPLLVPCPTTEDKYAKEDLRSRIDEKTQADYQHEFDELRRQYMLAKTEGAVEANRLLVTLFGSRLPHDPSRIQVVDDAAATVREIQSATPDILPLHTTERSTSG